jgi:PTS system mannose-specific IIA component
VIGVVIVTHGRLGEELHKTAKLIIGETEGTGERERCRTVAVEMNLNPDSLRDLVGEAIKSQDSGQGALVLTDMFGGTPSNVSLSFLEEGRVEVLTGVSLPMLLRVFQQREKPAITLDELAADATEYSRKSVVIAGKLLSQRRSK